MLIAMQETQSSVRTQAQYRLIVNIFIQAIDIRIGMVEDIVLNFPGKTTKLIFIAVAP